MEPETDYAKMLMDMEAKKAVLENAITSLRAALAAGALGAPASPESLPASLASSSAPVDLPVGAFLKKSIPAAIKLYLTAVKKKKTIREITTALKEGGVESTSDNFESVVTGALNRLKRADEVLRFKDGWGLAEYFPAHIRASVSERDKKPPRQKKKQQKRFIKGQETKASTQPEGLEKRISGLLRSDSNKIFATSEIAGALQANLSVVSLALGRMAAKNQAEKVAHGKYRAYAGKVQEIHKAG